MVLAILYASICGVWDDLFDLLDLMMRWVWAGWLFLFIASFAALEWYSLSHEEGLSLSQWTVDLLYAWPPAGPLVGALCGGLLVHFTWHWIPKQKIKSCEICGRTILIKNDRG